MSSPDIETRQEPSTKKFILRFNEITLDEGDYPVAFADYQGQTMGDIVVDAPQEFFGKKESRLINTIFFIVDLFPDLPDEGKKPVEFKQVLKSYEKDALEKVESRVRENQEYINKNTIEPVFRVCRSERPAKRLFAVRFLINKIDFLERIISEHDTYRNTVRSATKYAESLYAPQIEALKLACKANGIRDFSFRVVSAKHGDNLTGLLTKIVRKHKERSKHAKKV